MPLLYSSCCTVYCICSIVLQIRTNIMNSELDHKQTGMVPASLMRKKLYWKIGSILKFKDKIAKFSVIGDEIILYWITNVCCILRVSWVRDAVKISRSGCWLDWNGIRNDYLYYVVWTRQRWVIQKVTKTQISLRKSLKTCTILQARLVACE